jgi:DNA-binding NarL/FixJ family response regulator
VMAGGLYVDPAIASRMFDSQPNRVRQAPTAAAGLTTREIEVLKFTAAGLTNKEIARRIDIGVKSIETYKARAIEKLGLKTRSDVVRYALAQGWLADL